MRSEEEIQQRKEEVEAALERAPDPHFRDTELGNKLLGRAEAQWDWEDEVINEENAVDKYKQYQRRADAYSNSDEKVREVLSLRDEHKASEIGWIIEENDDEVENTPDEVDEENMEHHTVSFCCRIEADESEDVTDEISTFLDSAIGTATESIATRHITIIKSFKAVDNGHAIEKAEKWADSHVDALDSKYEHGVEVASDSFTIYKED